MAIVFVQRIHRLRHRGERVQMRGDRDLEIGRLRGERLREKSLSLSPTASLGNLNSPRALSPSVIREEKIIEREIKRSLYRDS